jgi:hypothetical protein
MAVFNDYPDADGELARGPAFSVRDCRDSQPHAGLAHSASISGVHQYLVVRRDAVPAMLDQGWSVARPVASRTDRVTGPPSQLALQMDSGRQQLTDWVSSRLVREGVVDGLALSFDALDALIAHPRELGRILQSPGDPFGADWISGLAGLIGDVLALSLGASPRVDSNDVRGDLGYALVGPWGCIFPSQRLHKVLVHGSTWILRSYAIGLGCIGPSNSEALLEKP